MFSKRRNRVSFIVKIRKKIVFFTFTWMKLMLNVSFKIMVIDLATIQVIGEKCWKTFGVGIFQICNFDSFLKHMIHKIQFFPKVSIFLSVWIDLMIVKFDRLLIQFYKSRYEIVCISLYFFLFLTVINFWDISQVG